MKTKSTALCLVIISLVCAWTSAFQVVRARTSSSSESVAVVRQLTAGNTPSPPQDVQEYLEQQFPAFTSMVLSKNDKVWKTLRDTPETDGCTVFAPVDEAFASSLGDSKRKQLLDDRNRETVEKIAAYHVIGEPVTADELFASGGVITLGGDIPVDRSTSGGLFGVFGAKEDGGVTINGAQVVETVNIGDKCIVHSVDKLVSPTILWRYMDQLRIPGTG